MPLASLLAGCMTPGDDHGSSHATKSCCATNIPAASFSDKSLYQVQSSWTNDVGRTLRLGDLNGRPQLVMMFFASCTYACPILVHDLQRIEAALPDSVRRDLGVTLVTIDPERDTAAALRDFRASRKLPTERWTLLRGNAADTLELALLLGVKYKREGNGQYAHSNLITLLNRQGEIVYQLAGLNQQVDDAVKHIVNAAGRSTASIGSHD